MAEGADHEPSARRATTTPDPPRTVPRKPALKTVRIARPYVSRALATQLRQRPRPAETYLCIGENLRRNDLIRAKRLFWVDKGCQNLARLPALACQAVSDVMVSRFGAKRPRQHSLPIDEGSGLLIENPFISTVLLGYRRCTVGGEG